MKLFFKIFFILFFIQVNSQKNNHKFINCDSIKKGIGSLDVYDTLPNGKLIGRYDVLMKENVKIYKIVTDENRVFYVSNPVMKKIKKSIRKNKCNGILINRINYEDNLGRRILQP